MMHHVSAVWLLPSRCQLCLDAVGCIEHRFACPTTRPLDGGYASAPKANLARASLCEQRRRCLDTHGLLAMNVHIPKFTHEGGFRWIVRRPYSFPRSIGLFPARWSFPRFRWGRAAAARIIMVVLRLHPITSFPSAPSKFIVKISQSRWKC